MCGILGCFGKDAHKFVADGMKIIQHRGNDAFGYFNGKHIMHFDDLNVFISSLSKDNSDFVIAHNLHAIVNRVSQPLQSEKSIFAMNGEIYNWETLRELFSIDASNDSDLFHKLIDKIGIKKALLNVRGVYAIFYYDTSAQKIYIARDIIGIKPVWYFFDDVNNKPYFAFSSEAKAFPDFFMQELNPRNILEYDVFNNEIRFIHRGFFSLTPEIYDPKQLLCLLQDSILMRIPTKKFGLLFSGGLDSVVLAKILKNLGSNFVCYTAATLENSPDLIYAKKAAEHLGVELKYKIVSPEEVKESLQEIVPLIEDNNVVKVGVALPIYFASQLARDDSCKVIFSGSGADELFAGYNRYKKSALDQLNKDCFSDVLKIYEKNAYRDDVITMSNHLELRVPYLDKDVVEYSLRIVPELKIKDGVEKYILRKLALDLGIDEEFAMRPKKAAQYGSGFDKILGKLSGGRKSEFLKKYYDKGNIKLGALISSGKDGLFATYIMKKQNYDISCFITMKSKNNDSFMFHTPNVNLAEMQAEAAGIPIVVGETDGKKETELFDLKETIMRAKEKYSIQGIVTGALYSNYQRTRIEKIADELGLKVFSPLWHIDQENEMRQLLLEGFKFMFSSVAAEGLNSSWLGRVIKESDIDGLVELNRKIGLNIAGEGGEFESLVLDCPLFNKKLDILDYDTVKDENSFRIVVKDVRLIDK